MRYEDIVKFNGSQGRFDPCFAFSLHKCGSTMMNRMLKDAFVRADIPWVDIPGPLYQNGVGPEWYRDKGILSLIRPGYVYLGYRVLPQVFLDSLDFGRSFNVLLVRDPRDALVSQYYSFKPNGSHALPKVKAEVFYNRLKAAAEGLTIDEYVLKMAPTTVDRFLAYKPLLEAGQIKVYKYEDAFFDKETFLRNILVDMKISVADNIISEVAAKHDIRPKKEDPSQHIRKGIPGDYKEKLMSDTISALDLILAPALKLYNYSRSSTAL